MAAGYHCHNRRGLLRPRGVGRILGHPVELVTLVNAIGHVYKLPDTEGFATVKIRSHQQTALFST